MGLVSDLRVEALELIDVGDRVIAPTVLHGRMRNSGTEVNDAYGFVFALREGLIVEALEYRTKEQALEAGFEAWNVRFGSV